MPVSLVMSGSEFGADFYKISADSHVYRLAGQSDLNICGFYTLYHLYQVLTSE